jgi:ribosome-associated protein
VTATDRAVQMVQIAAAAAADKKATDIEALDVSEALVITDAFLLCSGANEPQIGAIVDEVERKMREAGFKPFRREGERERRWVLLDFVDIVVHVQHEEERVHYALERLWKDCPTIPLGLPEEGSTD